MISLRYSEKANCTSNNDPVRHTHGRELSARARIIILVASDFCCSTAIINTDSFWYLHPLADVRDVVRVIGLVLYIHIV